MKRITNILLAISLTCTSLVSGQTDTENYIYSTSFREAFTKAQVDAGTPLDNEKIETITYVDGMGRVKQTISLRAGGNRENIIQHNEYDDLGRQQKQYLPYATASQVSSSTAANYLTQSSALTNTLNFYDTAKYQDTENPYTENIYEKSPRSRVMEVGAPGEDWEYDPLDNSRHTIRTDYDYNNALEVYQFTVSPNDPDLEYDGTYLKEELSKTILKDENWISTDGANNTVETFTDQQGRLILKRYKVYDAERTTNQTYTMDTYYIYDDFGNLAYVLPPEASDQIISGGSMLSGTALENLLDDFAYQYRYDERNRLKWKKLPGKDYEIIVYDKLDRPVLTQDANLRADNKFLFTKYDAIDRVVYTGIYTSPTAQTQAQMQTTVNNQSSFSEEATPGYVTIGGTNVYYSNSVFPTSTTNSEVLTVSYYDRYVDMGGLSSPPSSTSYGDVITTRYKGLPTVSKVKVLDGGSTQNWITTVSGYDEKGRVIYVKSENPYLGKTDLIENQLDFTGNVLESKSVHDDTAGSLPDITIYDYFTYDHVGRLTHHEQMIDDEKVQLIAHNSYDNMGQLVQKKVGGETYVDGYSDILNLDISPDETIENIATTTGWNAGLLTRGKILGEGGVQFEVNTENKLLRVGLYKTGQSVPYNYVHYGIELTEEEVGTSGTYKVKYIVNGSASYASVTYDAANTPEFTVERVENGANFKIEYAKNGTVFHTATSSISTDPLVGKAVFHAIGGKIDHLDLIGTNIDKVLQEVDYKYNVRGWLTDINNIDGGEEEIEDLFNFKIQYNESPQGTASVPKLYNGNISQTIWKTVKDDTKRSYAYQYDQVDRLIKATGRKGSTLSTAEDFNVEDITYDLNGNILTLKRHGTDGDGTVSDIWDELTYTYSGNQLTKVVDGAEHSDLFEYGFKDDYTGSSDEYEYDDNGNMVMDRNKSLQGYGTDDSILYNYLNLPDTITVYQSPSSSTVRGIITYIYDAIGTRLEKKVVEGLNTYITQYAGQFIYLDDELQFISHSEGYIAPLAIEESNGGFEKGGSGTITYSTYDYVFQYTDHLGNVRLSYSDENKNGAINKATEIIEESNYYPFGLKQLGYNNVITSYGNDLAQEWKFNGMQLSSDLDLKWYDFGARNYDAVLGRWMNHDPLAETSRRFSPYAFALDNPIFFIDPDGMEATASNIYGASNPGMGAASSGHFGLTEIAGGNLRIDVTGANGSTHVPIIEGSFDKSDLGKAADRVGSSDNGGCDKPPCNGINSQNSPQTLSRVAPVADFESLDNVIATEDKLKGPTYNGEVKGGPGMIELIGGGPVFIKGFGWVKKLLKAEDAVQGSRGLWKLTEEGASVVKYHSKFGKFFKSKSDNLWWSVDRAGHGGSKFKVFKETKKGLQWIKDADEFGDFIIKKHKGATGSFIPWGQLKTLN